MDTPVTAMMAERKPSDTLDVTAELISCVSPEKKDKNRMKNDLWTGNATCFKDVRLYHSISQLVLLYFLYQTLLSPVEVWQHTLASSETV